VSTRLFNAVGSSGDSDFVGLMLYSSDNGLRNALLAQLANQ